MKTFKRETERETENEIVIERKREREKKRETVDCLTILKLILNKYNYGVNFN